MYGVAAREMDGGGMVGWLLWLECCMEGYRLFERTSRGGRDGVSMPETSWSAWGWMRI